MPCRSCAANRPTTPLRGPVTSTIMPSRIIGQDSTRGHFRRADGCRRFRAPDRRRLPALRRDDRDHAGALQDRAAATRIESREAVAGKGGQSIFFLRSFQRLQRVTVGRNVSMRSAATARERPVRGATASGPRTTAGPYRWLDVAPTPPGAGTGSGHRGRKRVDQAAGWLAMALARFSSASCTPSSARRCATRSSPAHAGNRGTSSTRRASCSRPHDG